MKILNKISLILLITGYLLAGLNHFIHPSSYTAIIPRWLPAHGTLNVISGAFEIFFSLLLILPKTRRWGALGIILLLISFLPVHTKMVDDAPFRLGSLMVTPLIAWVRLVILQPLLILWAWWHRK